jgi:hypothetical protein
MARLAPIAILAFAVTLACGGPAAPTATPPAPAATPTSLAPLASPTRLTPIPSPGAAIQPSLPAPRDAIDEKLLAWSTAWATVQRFSVEIETKDAAGMVYNRSIMRVVRPDRYHLTNLDLETRQPRTQTIVIGSKTWVKLAGSDRWESFDGQGALRLRSGVEPRQPLERARRRCDALVRATRTRDDRRCSVRALANRQRTAGRGHAHVQRLDRRVGSLAAADRVRATGRAHPAAALQLQPGLRHPATAMSRAHPRLAARRPLPCRAGHRDRVAAPY